jgi:ribosomal protein L31
MRNPFRYFNSSPEVISLAVMMYIRYPLSLRQVEDILFERGIDICHETVRLWWNRFGPMFAAEIRKRRAHHRSYSQWRRHVDEVFVRINGETHYIDPSTHPARTGVHRLVDSGGRLARSGKRFENFGLKGRGIPIV